MDCKNVIVFLLIMVAAATSYAQRQLIVLKKERVIARYQVGDVIKFFRPGEKQIQIQRILDLNDTLLMMNLDSVAYYRISKVDIRAKERTRFTKGLGMALITAGAALPLIDVFNTSVIQDNDASVSQGVWIASGTMVGTGALLLVTQKPYFKPRRRNRLLIVDEQSPFYKERFVNDGFTSPYIPKN